MMYFRKTDATTSLKDGGAVRLDNDGTLGNLLNDTDDRIIGICRKTIAATDTAFVGAPLVPVQVPVEDFVEWEVDLDSDGGASATDVGRYCAIDTAQASDSESTHIDISDTGIRHFLVTGVSDTVVDRARVVIVKRASLALDTV